MNHSLTLFLLVLTKYFKFDQYNKSQKKQKRMFYRLVVYIVLYKKLIKGFGKIMLRMI